MIEAIKDNWWYIAGEEEPTPTYKWRPINPYCVVETVEESSTCAGIDLAIILDITGSMSEAITNVRNSLDSILSSIASKYGDYRLSLITVSDSINSGTGQTYYEIPVKFALSNKSAVQTSLNVLVASEGGETPEPHDLALQGLLDGKAGAFRSGVTKAVFIITDAPNSGYNDAYTSTDLSFANSLSTRAKDQGIRVYSIITANSSNAQTVGNAYVGTTGGQLYVNTNGNISNDIVNALGAVQCETIPGSSGNTGYVAYSTLEEYDELTGLATGNTKPNIENDPDYVMPIYNSEECPAVTFEINPTYKLISNDWSIFTINVTTNAAWQVISKPGWVMLSDTSGTSNKAITVNVSINKGEPRIGVITFICGDITKTCTINQGEQLVL